MQTLVLENTAPFQGLCELVADDEGLFAEQGLRIEWVDRESGLDRRTHVGILSPDGLDPHSSHGKLFEEGRADMYNACEWGNYCRVQDSGIESGRQVGRRSIVTYAAIAVRPDSDVFTTQQLAGRLVGVPFYFGTHYLALHMLEGFLPRERIRVCSAPMGSRFRLDSMMSGEIEATTLTEPYITLAEKKGCRILTAAFYHGTEVASHRVDAATYARFNRAVCEAVRRIDADKGRYLRYFIDYHGADPEIAALSAGDLRESRIVVVEPAPIPDAELARTAAWIRSWGMLRGTDDPASLVDREVQSAAHRAAP
ncbi:MAG: hypothetical protein OXC28_21610 [Defluviicoccus sp.]|nr:hypothetical protein [Defluviicoccus sp.]